MKIHLAFFSLRLCNAITGNRAALRRFFLLRRFPGGASAASPIISGRRGAPPL